MKGTIEVHGGGQDWKVREATGAYGVNVRHCSFCGSIHPDDLVTLLDNGAVLEIADFKYGWPHKFYVSGIPNPRAGEIVEMGGTYSHNKFYPSFSPAPKTLTVKFYNEHLNDLEDEEFELVAKLIQEHSHVSFKRSTTGEMYYSLTSGR